MANAGLLSFDDMVLDDDADETPASEPFHAQIHTRAPGIDDISPLAPKKITISQRKCAEKPTQKRSYAEFNPPRVPVEEFPVAQKRRRTACVLEELVVSSLPPPQDIPNKAAEDGGDVIHSLLPNLCSLEFRFDEEFRRKKPTYQNVPQIHEYYMESGQRWSSFSTGDERIAALRAALAQLDRLGFQRSNHQREFHEAFIAACLPQIYGDDLDRCLMRILEENDCDEIHSELMVCCPRRWGKTMAVALFCAAYLYTQPNAEMCVYSIVRRTSTMLVLKIYKMVVALAGGTQAIKHSNQEKLEVVNMYGGISICYSYPSASKIRLSWPSFFLLVRGGFFASLV